MHCWGQGSKGSKLFHYQVWSQIAPASPKHSLSTSVRDRTEGLVDHRFIQLNKDLPHTYSTPAVVIRVWQGFTEAQPVVRRTDDNQKAQVWWRTPAESIKRWGHPSLKAQERLPKEGRYRLSQKLVKQKAQWGMRVSTLSKGNVMCNGLEVSKSGSYSENWRKYRLSGAKCPSPVLTLSIL